MTIPRLRHDALAIFRAALDAADARNAVLRTMEALRLPLDRQDKLFVIAVGKAAPAMASALEAVLGERIEHGLVVTKYGHLKNPLRKFEIFESSHPVPDEAGVKASDAVVELAGSLRGRDLLIVALSGGASALLPAPVPPVSLADKQITTDLLLKAGASINELNTVRKHLSRLKGGRLALLAHPARVISLILSDVIGDPLDVIASGPTAPDPSTFGDAIRVLEKFELMAKVPDSVRTILKQGAPETPKPDDPLFDRVTNIIVGSNRLALEAAANQAVALGYETQVLSSEIEGEARVVALAHAELLKHAKRPACILSGGETTVTVRGNGKGGRNQEFALAISLTITGVENVVVLSAGTDGTDGPTDAAGAFATGDTIQRAREAGLSPEGHLARHDSYPFFETLGDLLKTGPTGTNVMDIHIMLAGKN